MVKFQSLYSKLMILLLILPPALSLLYIYTFSVNTIYFDQWDTVALLQKQSAGTLAFGDLFANYNGHKIFFPRLLMLALANISHYNTTSELYLSWLVSLISFSLLLSMYLKRFGASTDSLAKFLPAAWLFFSLRQSDNLLTGWQLTIYLSMLGVIAAIYLLSRQTRPAFAAAAAASTIASFSFMTGLLAWPTGLAYLLLSKQSLQRIAAWILLSALAISAYFYNWSPTSELLFIPNHFSTATTYFTTAIGSPLAFEQSHALAAAAVLLLLAAATVFFTVKIGRASPNAVWLSFILFALLSTFSLMLGRASTGMESALNSSYTSITLLGIIGLYILSLDLYLKKDSSNSTLYGPILTLILLGILIGAAYGIDHGKALYASRMVLAKQITDYRCTPDWILGRLYSNASTVSEGAEFLDSHKLNVFYPPASPISRTC